MTASSGQLCPAVHILGSQNVYGRALLALGRLFSFFFLMRQEELAKGRTPLIFPWVFVMVFGKWLGLVQLIFHLLSRVKKGLKKAKRWRRVDPL